jgi:hypothetical protein
LCSSVTEAVRASACPPPTHHQQNMSSFVFPFGALEFSYHDRGKAGLIQFGCTQTDFLVCFKSATTRIWSRWHGAVIPFKAHVSGGPHGFTVCFHCRADERELVKLTFQHDNSGAGPDHSRNAFYAYSNRRPDRLYKDALWAHAPVIIMYRRWVVGTDMMHSSRRRAMLLDNDNGWFFV